VTLNDIRVLANILMQAEPGLGGMTARGVWASVCGDVAADIRKRKLVDDHQFDEGVFLDTCLGKGEYLLSDPDEDDKSWDPMVEDGHTWRSRPVLGKDQA
jgi:hypothetical protein